MPDINLSFEIIAILFVVGGIAGFIDALAGGGGLISLPALLLTGMPPINAIATNKFQGIFGTLTSSITVFKKKAVTRQDVFSLVFAAFVGSSIGAIILLFIDAKNLEFIIPFVLISIALYFIFAPRLDDIERKPKINRPIYRFVITPIIGLYDGLLGPGAGSFYATAGVAMRGQTIIKSTSIAKFLNFASNFAAVIVFVFSGKIIWIAGGIMIVGQILGGYLGSLAIVNGGAKFIRPLIIIMSGLMTAKYLYSIWG